MKQKLLKQTFLVLALLGAGITNAWAAPAESNVLKTMTGRVGLTDNTSAAFTYGSKVITLAANETYAMTFVNHNAGSGNKWNNWILEGNNGTYYFDFRADGGYWGSLFDNNLATANYNGKTHSDVSGVSTDVDDTWMAAYNGVNVTLTATRSADGGTLTFTHSATTNNSVAYSGTFTVTLTDASSTINFYITNEASYQDITSVVYTNASGEVTHYELKDVDLSQFSGDFCSYADGVETFSVSSATQKWCTLDLSDYFSGITGTITDVNMTLTENISGVVDAVTKTNRLGIGIYGDTRSSFPTPNNVDRNNSINWWGITGKDAANRIYYGSSSSNTYVSGLTLNADAKIVVLTDVINKKFSFIQDNTIKVNNQAFGDEEITRPKYLAVQTWSTPVAATMTDVTMEIVYLETTYYTATFTNTASNNTVSATIYTDSGRETEISNGLLENGTTYYFTATEDGYEDYNGEFTVNGSDPSVSFAMTAKEVYNYSVNAVDNESGIIKANIVSGNCYAGETASFYLPTCVLVDGTLYFTTAEASAKSETVSSNNQVFTYEYTTSTVNNVVFFVEGEDISGASQCIATNNQKLASNGYMGRGSNLSVTTLPAGQYTVYVKYINTNSGAHTVIVKADESNIINNTEVTARPTLNGSITLSESSAITLTAAGSSTSGVDYLYIVKTGEVKSISSAGWATYCSPYALDFSGTISGLTNAYFVTGASGTTLTLSEIEGTIPANTGILLEGSEGSITIPVVASSDTDVTSNKLEGVLEETVKAANSIYVLLKENNVVGFYKNANAFTVGANTAYLPANFTDGARLFYNFYDDTTGLNVIDNGQLTIDNSQVYDLQGRRVNGQLKKGLYIINGKKVAIK